MYSDKVSKLFEADNYQRFSCIDYEQCKTLDALYLNDNKVQATLVNFYLDFNYLHFNMLLVFFVNLLDMAQLGYSKLEARHPGFKLFFFKLAYLFDIHCSYDTGFEASPFWEVSSFFLSVRFRLKEEEVVDFTTKYPEGCFFRAANYNGKFKFKLHSSVYAPIDYYYGNEARQQPINKDPGIPFDELYSLALELFEEFKLLCKGNDTVRVFFGAAEIFSVLHTYLDQDSEFFKGIKDYFA
jgi:hypothetical protein